MDGASAYRKVATCLMLLAYRGSGNFADDSGSLTADEDWNEGNN
jgi:hypothetical protein